MKSKIVSFLFILFFECYGDSLTLKVTSYTFKKKYIEFNCVLKNISKNEIVLGYKNYLSCCNSKTLNGLCIKYLPISGFNEIEYFFDLGYLPPPPCKEKGFFIKPNIEYKFEDVMYLYDGLYNSNVIKFRLGISKGCNYSSKFNIVGGINYFIWSDTITVKLHRP